MKNHKYISTKREKIIVEIFALIVIAQQVFIFYPYFKNIEVQPQSQKQVSEDSEVIDITPPLKPKEFISNKLGISFTYDESNFSVEEKGGMISLTANGQNSGDNQYVRVFTKDPKMALNKAIANVAIPNKDPRECFVMVNQDTDFPDVYQAEIIYPDDPNNTEGPAFAYAACGQYQRTNSMRYFYYNKNYPDRFYFFNIGTYPIFSGLSATSTWQNTFKILK